MCPDCYLPGSAQKPFFCFGREANCGFRHRSLLFLYSRPCRTVSIDLFPLAKTLSSHFSVQKHQFQKNASMNTLEHSRILEFLNHLPGNPGFRGTRICLKQASVPNSLTPAQQIEQNKSFRISSMDDNFPETSFCAENRPGSETENRPGNRTKANPQATKKGMPHT